VGLEIGNHRRRVDILDHPRREATSLEVAINDHITDAAGARGVGKLRLPGLRNVRQRLGGNRSGRRRGSLREVRRRVRLLERRLGHASLGSPATAGLRQREWDRADGEKRKQDQCAPKQVRLNGWINLFFHVFVPLDFWELTEAIRCVCRCAYIVGNMVLAGSA
jgi:hypothetical protein